MRRYSYGANGEIFKIETAYSRYDLRREHGRLELRDAAGALQSVLDPNQPQRLLMENLQFLVSVMLFVPTPRRILLLGTGAGSLLYFLRHHYAAEMTAVDIDAELTERLQHLELLPPAGNGLVYCSEDAGRFVDRCGDRFDLIFFDIFEGSQSPRWLGEKRRLQRLFDLLSPRGALAFNLLIDSEHEFTRFYRSLQAVCRQQTLSTPVAGLENTIVFGFRDQLPARGLDWYLRHTPDLAREHGIDYLQILSAIYTTNPQGMI